MSKYMNLISKDLYQRELLCEFALNVLQGISKKGQTLTCRICIIITCTKVDLLVKTDLNLKRIKFSVFIKKPDKKKKSCQNAIIIL